jgi:hypothetical protein
LGWLPDYSIEHTPFVAKAMTFGWDSFLFTFRPQKRGALGLSPHGSRRGCKLFDCGYPGHTPVHHLRFRCSPRMCHALFRSTSLYFEDQALKDEGMKTEVPRCPYCGSNERFMPMKELENRRQICESCGHIVFPDDKAFLCPCQKCLASRFRMIA